MALAYNQKAYNSSEVSYSASTVTYEGVVSHLPSKNIRLIVPTTAAITVSATITGSEKDGSDHFSYQLFNSSAVDETESLSVPSGSTAALAVTTPSSAKYVFLLPPSTNTVPLQVSGSTSETGFALSSQGVQFFSVFGGTTFYLYTTHTTNIDVRMMTF